MKKNISGRFVFLLLAVLMYLPATLYDAERALAAWHYSRTLAIQIAPVLLLVFAIMLLGNLLLSSKWVKKHLGRDAGPKAWLFSVIGGVLSPGPIYPWLTVLKEMKDHGMRPALIAVFLYSRGVKLPMLPLLIHYFGSLYALLLCLYVLVFAILSGVVIEKLPGIAGSK